MGPFGWAALGQGLSAGAQAFDAQKERRRQRQLEALRVQWETEDRGWEQEKRERERMQWPAEDRLTRARIAEALAGRKSSEFDLAQKRAAALPEAFAGYQKAGVAGPGSEWALADTLKALGLTEEDVTSRQQVEQLAPRGPSRFTEGRSGFGYEAPQMGAGRPQGFSFGEKPFAPGVAPSTYTKEAAVKLTQIPEPGATPGMKQSMAQSYHATLKSLLPDDEYMRDLAETDPAKLQAVIEAFNSQSREFAGQLGVQPFLLDAGFYPPTSRMEGAKRATEEARPPLLEAQTANVEAKTKTEDELREVRRDKLESEVLKAQAQAEKANAEAARAAARASHASAGASRAGSEDLKTNSLLIRDESLAKEAAALRGRILAAYREAEVAAAEANADRPSGAKDISAKPGPQQQKAIDGWRARLTEIDKQRALLRPQLRSRGYAPPLPPPTKPKAKTPAPVSGGRGRYSAFSGRTESTLLSSMRTAKAQKRSFEWYRAGAKSLHPDWNDGELKKLWAKA